MYCKTIKQKGELWKNVVTYSSHWYKQFSLAVERALNNLVKQRALALIFKPFGKLPWLMFDDIGINLSVVFHTFPK